MSAEGRYFSQGLKTLKVPMKMHADNRAKLVAALKKATKVPERAIILLRGGASKPIDDSDIEFVFKQESHFQYSFGVMEPDFMGAIDCSNGSSVLFVPHLDAGLQVVFGKIESPAFYAAKYEVSEARFVSDLPAYVAEKDPELIYIISGVNSDSGFAAAEPKFDGIENYRISRDVLYDVACECRVQKSEEEMKIMRYVVGVTAEAHKAVMRAVKPGMMEYQLEATFLHSMYFDGGCRNCGYTPICASGERCATLHYGHAGRPNDQQVKDGDLCLIDCGAEYDCYDGDLTTTFPANGKFTQDQKDIYETVYAMQKGVEAQMKPGVSWPDMHRLAERICLTELKKRGFLQGDIDEMMKQHMGAVFMPHGLGHLLGLDTHDVGGYPRGQPRRIMLPGIRKLRTARNLVEGMCITCEPGVYFNEFTLDPALANPETRKFFVLEKIEKFRHFGGIRLEDDVHVTATGCEVLDDVPRTIPEIEAFMAGKEDYHHL